MLDLPTEKKTTAKELLKDKLGIDERRFTRGANVFNGLFAIGSIPSNNLAFGVLLLLWNLYSQLPAVGSDVKGTSEATVTLAGLGTGGPDYTVLDGSFLHTSSKSDVCDGENWLLAPGASSALVTYASSSPMGASYQLDFIPTGKNGANVTFGRFDVYEITFGEDSFQHLSLKNLQTKELVTLFSLSQNSEDKGSRINMGVSLSTSTSNLIRIDEKVVSEGSYNLDITVNGKRFSSKEITLLNQSKYQSLYLGLIDTSLNKSNNTGLISPLLSICE